MRKNWLQTASSSFAMGSGEKLQDDVHAILIMALGDGVITLSPLQLQFWEDMMTTLRSAEKRIVVEEEIVKRIPIAEYYAMKNSES